MKKTVTSLVGAFALLLVIGAGCNATTEEPGREDTAPSASENNATPPTGGTWSESTPVTGEETGGLTLSAEARGNMEVTLSWQTGETLDDKNRFVLVRGAEESPSHDGKHDWFRQFYTVREVIWKQDKTGPTHFRVCLTEDYPEKKDTCTVYSNDVVVEVK